MSQVLHEFEPLLQAIAGATTKRRQRRKIEALLPKLEQKGWQLTDAVHRIWSGERDLEALTAGLDEQDTALIRRILELLSG